MDSEGGSVGQLLSVRSKLVSAWNRMKYSKGVFNLETKASFSDSSPVWLLGLPYHRKLTVQQNAEEAKDSTEMAAFERDYISRLWFTYRRNMDKIPRYQSLMSPSNSNGPEYLTSDCGWGCMLRSGQMMLGQALLMHHLGREWSWSEHPRDELDKLRDDVHRAIITLFADFQGTSKAPFSIHNMLRLAAQSGKGGGDWFGPAAVAHLLQQALQQYAQGSRATDCLLANIRIYVAQDCTVYKQDIIDMCESNVTQTPAKDVIKRRTEPVNLSEESSFNGGDSLTNYSVISVERNGDTFTQIPKILDLTNLQIPFGDEMSESWCVEQSVQITNGFSALSSESSWRSVVILVPVRLGGETFNPYYSSCLKSLLTLPSCIGWIGGKPGHALYFIGFQDDNLIHLDPHRLQDRVEDILASPEGFSTESYHCRHPRKLAFKHIDPSSCLGFYLRTRDEFEAWCEGIAEFVTPPSLPTTNNKSASRQPPSEVGSPTAALSNGAKNIRRHIVNSVKRADSPSEQAIAMLTAPSVAAAKATPSSPPPSSTSRNKSTSNNGVPVAAGPGIGGHEKRHNHHHVGSPRTGLARAAASQPTTGSTYPLFVVEQGKNDDDASKMDFSFSRDDNDMLTSINSINVGSTTSMFDSDEVLLGSINSSNDMSNLSHDDYDFISTSQPYDDTTWIIEECDETAARPNPRSTSVETVKLQAPSAGKAGSGGGGGTSNGRTCSSKSASPVPANAVMVNLYNQHNHQQRVGNRRSTSGSGNNNDNDDFVIL